MADLPRQPHRPLGCGDEGRERQGVESTPLLDAVQGQEKLRGNPQGGFIRAETVAYDDLIQCGSYNAAKEKGLVRSEGKDYIVKDGDILLIRFNV